MSAKPQPVESLSKRIGIGENETKILRPSSENEPMMRSLLFFVLAGLCELGGGYLVWLALREGKSPWLAVLGVVVLGIYGAVPTLQPTHFGRAYAAYGGIFIVLSIVWGWVVDRVRPDRFDLTGGWIILLGGLVMMYAPRRSG